MTIQFKRKLYHRGGSFETTIPVQMLFERDLSKKNDVLFEFDKKNRKWLVSIVERHVNVVKKKNEAIKRVRS